MNMPRRHPGRRAGQSMVEMALALPLLALLLIGVAEFGLILFAHVQVSNAAREGARAASLYRSTRYHLDNKSAVISCGAVDSWSLQQTIDQAVVFHTLSSGCPDKNGAVVYSSLGWLDATASITTTIEPAQSTFANPDQMPAQGAQGTFTLEYPYRLIFLSQLFPFLHDPIVISKSVKFEYQ